jgi:hypothetical protein
LLSINKNKVSAKRLCIISLNVKIQENGKNE